jgi:thiol-disulfide isomerase/thioredoxin
MEALLGPSLVNKAGDALPTSAALSGASFVACYFSAHWCGPCRGFTPKLNEFFAAHAERLKLKVVFVTSDRDADSFRNYFEEMAWDLALPFGSEHKKTVGADVRGIPTLKLFRADTGELVTSDARLFVTDDPDGASFPWGDPAYQAQAKERRDAAAKKAREEKYARAIVAPPHAHPLVATAVADPSNRFCDVCSERIKAQTYVCMACNYDECGACYEKRSGGVPQAVGE